MCVRKRETDTERDTERKRKRDTIVARRGERGEATRVLPHKYFLMDIKCNKTQK
jgi:hypothetical protein